MTPFEFPLALLLLVAVTSAACSDLTIGESHAKAIPARIPKWIEGGYVAADTALPVLNICNPIIESTMSKRK